MTTVVITEALHDVFSQYLKRCLWDDLSPHSHRAYRRAFTRLDTYLKENSLDALDIDPRAMQEYFHGLKDNLATASRKLELAAIRGCYAYAIKTDLVNSNPTRLVKIQSELPHKPDTYTNGELTRIFDSVTSARGELLIVGLAYTGLRRQELLNLRWSDIQGDEMHVIGKGNKPRLVPIHPQLTKALLRWRNHEDHSPECEYVIQSKRGKQLSPEGFNLALNKILRRAGVDGGSRPAHKFRRTATSSLIEEGVATSTVDLLMGWSPTSVRQRYYTRVSDQSLYEAIAHLYPSISSTP